MEKQSHRWGDEANKQAPAPARNPALDRKSIAKHSIVAPTYGLLDLPPNLQTTQTPKIPPPHSFHPPHVGRRGPFLVASLRSRRLSLC